jgi:hypothetical protein
MPSGEWGARLDATGRATGGSPFYLVDFPGDVTRAGNGRAAGRPYL